MTNYKYNTPNTYNNNKWYRRIEKVNGGRRGRNASKALFNAEIKYILADIAADIANEEGENAKDAIRSYKNWAEQTTSWRGVNPAITKHAERRLRWALAHLKK